MRTSNEQKDREHIEVVWIVQRRDGEYISTLPTLNTGDKHR